MADNDDNKFALISLLQYIEKYFEVHKVFNFGDLVPIVPHLNQWVQLILTDKELQSFFMIYSLQS